MPGPTRHLCSVVSAGAGEGGGAAGAPGGAAAGVASAILTVIFLRDCEIFR